MSDAMSFGSQVPAIVVALQHVQHVVEKQVALWRKRKRRPFMTTGGEFFDPRTREGRRKIKEYRKKLLDDEFELFHDEYLS